jgi:alkanesulfonate monooxygenase SsuD/methylene tetrahydromethanopterin reductase-like flavin-dependent oxidoreductase (luciferase family)
MVAPADHSAVKLNVIQIGAPIGMPEPAMKVGLYFDLRNPPGWRSDFSRLYGFALEMCEEAERLGAHSVWFSEHHLFEDGYLTQPLTYCAAAAARTKRVRLGTAILIAPLQKPVHIAEQAVVVDLVSGGRLDVGLGSGYRIPEFELYGASLEHRYGVTDECARQLRAMWSGERVTPRPHQARIPIWMGYQGPQGAHRAGLLGEGLLSINPALHEPYLQGLREAGHPPSTARMCGHIDGWVSEDPERDWPIVAKHLAYQQDSYRRYSAEGTVKPTPKPVNPDDIRARGETRLGPYFFGEPHTVAAAVNAKYAGLPIECIYLWASVAGMAETMVADNVRTILTKFAPLLRI